MRRLLWLWLLVWINAQEVSKLVHTYKSNDVLGGNCVLNAAPSMGYQDDSKILYLHPFYPSNEEVEEYHALPDTLTSTNEALGIGLVNGKETAYNWSIGVENSWQLHVSHPRISSKPLCLNHTINAAVKPISIYDRRNDKGVRTWALISNIKTAFIHDSGIVGLDCGYIQLHDGCETKFRFMGRKWNERCRNNIAKHLTPNSTWYTLMDDKEKFMELCGIGNEPQRTEQGEVVVPDTYSRVFVMTSTWDHNYHHFIVDSLVRLARNYKFLIDNPDIYIHIRRYEQYAKRESFINGAIALRKGLLELIGISYDRIISGPIFAREVYLPTAPVCNSQVTYPYEHRLMARIIGTAAVNLATTTSKWKIDQFYSKYSRSRRNIILQHRPCFNEYDCGKTWREWSNDTFNSLYDAVSKKFPEHNIVTIRGDDTYFTKCIECQVIAYKNADAIVGIHGAGMQNIMHMSPGTLLYEIVGKFDGRMLPLCGYHGPLASIYGLHHAIYYYDWKIYQLEKPFHRLLNYQDIADHVYHFYQLTKK